MDCPLCGSALVKRSGKFGPFYGCSSYPGCRGILKVSQVERGSPVDADRIREQAAASARAKTDKRASDNTRVERSVELWRAAMIAADTTTEPPFDDVRLPGEMYAAYGRIGGPLTEIDGDDEPVMEDVDAEFAAMFR